MRKHVWHIFSLNNATQKIDMAASIQSRTHILTENISFIDIPDLKIAENSAQREKNMTSFPCIVRTEKFHPYTLRESITKKVTFLWTLSVPPLAPPPPPQGLRTLRGVFF